MKYAACSMVIWAVGLGASSWAQGHVDGRRLTGVVERKLSGSMVVGPPPTADFSPVFSPSGDRIVHCAQLLEEPGIRIVSAPSDPDLPGVVVGEVDEVPDGFLWSSSGSHIVYWTPWQIFAAPADASLPAALLHSATIHAVDQVAVSRSGAHVLFRRQGLLYSVPIGGGTPVSISGASTVSSFTSAAGGLVLFSKPNQIFSVPEDGSAPAQLLAAAPGVLDSTGQRAVYSLGDRLWSVPLDLSSPAIPLTPAAPGVGIGPYAVSPTVERVLYAADALVDGKLDVFTARTDGSTSALFELAMTTDPDDTISGVSTLTPDGLTGACIVLRISDHRVRWFCIAFDGSAVRLLWTNVGGIWRITPDSQHAVLSQGGDLYSQPIAPGAFRLMCGAHSNWQLSSTDALFARRPNPGSPTGLFRAPIRPPVHPPPPPVLMTDATDAPQGVARPFVAPDEGSVIFEGSVIGLGLDSYRLFRAELTGAPSVRRFRGLPGPLDRRGDVIDFVARGTKVVYAADQDEDLRYELYAVPADGSAQPLKLSDAPMSWSSVETIGPPQAPSGARIYLTPDGSRAVYLADTQGAKVELFSVPTDGSALPLRLNGPLDAGKKVYAFDVSLDGTRAAYATSNREIHSVPVAGGVPTPIASFGLGTSDLRISPDATRVVFVDDELYSAPLLGGAAPALLSGANQDVQTFQITADSARVLYTVGASGDRLYSVPLAGGAPVEPSPGAMQSFTLTEDGRRVLVVRRVLGPTGRTDKLLSVPVEGGSPAVLLHDVSATLDFYVSRGPRVLVYLEGLDHALAVEVDGSPSVALPAADDERLSPDGELVALRQGSTILTLPATGGTPSPLYTHPGLALIDFTPDGQRVIVSHPDGSYHAIPLSGGPRRRLISSAVDFAGRLEFVGPDRWLFLGERDDPGTVELFTGGIERLGPP